MRPFNTITLALVAAMLLLQPHSTLAQSDNQPQFYQRRLRSQHKGENHDTPTPAVLTGAAPAPASAPMPATGSGSPVQTGGVAVTPGSATTNVNVTPGTVNTNINFTPGTSTTTVSGVPAPASAPVSMPMPVPVPASAPAPAPAPAPAVAKPSSGMGFDLLSNPLSGVATLAHVAHGALLGHTGTLPSSYMQSNGQGGGHGH